MSRLAEIQDAVAHLPSDQRKVMQPWLNSQTEPDLTPHEEQRLVRLLDEAVRDIGTGKGVSMEEGRQRVGSWTSK